MALSDWSRRRKILFALFAFSAAFGFALIALSPPGSTSTTVELFIAVDVTVVVVLVLRPEWVPNLED